ncbi:hypothetical protein [Rhodanobacter lindaniclasticus]
MTIRPLLAIALSLSLGAGTVAAATTPGDFTATYQVSRGGSPMGTATISLHDDGGGRMDLPQGHQGHRRPRRAAGCPHG